MAKNPGPSFFDKHIEKVIVAVCCLIALAAIGYYGVSTPMRLEVPTGLNNQKEAVQPADLDKSLFEAAKRLEKKINSKKPEPLEPRDDVEMLTAFQNKPLGGIELNSVDFGMPMSIGKLYTGVQNIKDIQLSLEDVTKVIPKPATPFSWSGIELLGAQEFAGDESIAEGQLREDPIWRSVCWYPEKELLKQWQKALNNTVVIPQVVILGYEVEIQEQRPNGKWETIEDVKPFKMPEDSKTGRNEVEPVLPDFVINEKGESNIDEVRKAITDISTWAYIKLQPDYFSVWTKDGQISWQQHMPLEKIKAVYADVVTETPGAAVQPTGRTKTTRRSVRAAAMPMGMPPEMMGPGMVMPTAKRTTRSRRTSSKAAQMGDLLPSTEVQMTSGRPMAWFHINNIQFGKKYRCRFRWVFVNPLFTYVKSVQKDKVEDAYVKDIKSPWSDWSAPVSVNRKMEFFISGSNSQQKEVNVTVFTEVLGQLVRARFGQIGVGKEISGTSEVDVINPATGTRQKMQLKFDTGAVVLNINFAKRLITKSGLIKKDGVEMVYSDANGNVHSRVMYYDKNSAEFLSLTEEAVRGEPEREKPVLEKDKDKKRKTKTRMIGPGEMPAMPPEMMMPGGSNRRTGKTNTKVRF